MAWAADVVHHNRAAKLTGVVDDDVAKSHQSLWDAGGNSHVLDFAQGNIFRGAGDQSLIDLEF